MGNPRRQRVLLVHRYFDPDMTTYAQMLAQYAEHLGRLGHDVTVLCGPANYNGVYDGPPVTRHEEREHYTIHRARLPKSPGRLGKLIGFAVFPVVVVMHCWRSRRPFDLVSVTTMPPVMMGVAGFLGTRRGAGRLVYHCMDLYPEVLGTPSSGRGKAIAAVARSLDAWVMRRADPVIVLSVDMRATVLARPGSPITVSVSNNFIIESHKAPLVPRERSGARFRLIFAGNLGRFQGIDRLIDAFMQLDGDAELLFLGAGPMVTTIRAASHRDQRIRHHPHVPVREAMEFILEADAAVVSLEPGVIATAYPSKVLMYLELGRQLLAIVEPESALARMVVDQRLGAIAPPDDPSAITGAMAALRSDRTLRSPSEVQAFGRAHFGKNIVLDRWTTLYGLDSP